MTSHKQTIQAFCALGQLFRDYTAQVSREDNWIQNLDNALLNAKQLNKWFTKENLRLCIDVWGETLTESAISMWLSNYPEPSKQQRLGLVLAGNVPLVGLHDILCGLASGCTIEAKLSSNDTLLLPLIAAFLTEMEPSWKDNIHFTQDKLSTYDKVIATGSNNTARYFEYYFRSKPHIIRKTRNGVAVLDGKESKEDLAGLCNDMLRYFGLGCRSISHLMVPNDYDFNDLFLALYEHKDIIHHNAYANNYDYNKAVYLMQEQELLENGFMMLKNDESLNSPIACVHYSRYDNLKEAKEKISNNQEGIQCVVANCVDNALSFGQTQHPSLHDYADHVDTMDFLLKNEP